jgi:hypothetical protein
MVRDVYLSTARVARTLIATPEVAAQWEAPSALERMTVGAVAAHLARAVLTVRDYMAMPLPEPPPEPIDAAEYFALGVPLTNDLDDDLNTSIRARSDAAANEGRDAVVRDLDELLVTVEAALAAAAPDAQVAVFGITPMSLDDYLVTRTLELVVHIDDLAVSAGVETPVIDPRAVDLVTQCFVSVARIRHGDLEVLRALARRERASAPVFPVF